MKPRSLAVPIVLSLSLIGCPREPPPPSWLQPSTTAASAQDVQTAPSAPKGPPQPFESCEKTRVSDLIRVDQFGYRPSAKKVAVVVDPVEGWNAREEMPAPGSYEVRSWNDGKVLLSAVPQPWNGGAVQKQAGDRGYWFDFSAVTAEGSYCVVDRQQGVRSHRFDVRASVYRPVLQAAERVFYFQRANFAKVKPFACVGEKCWLGAADYVGPGQDRQARSVRDRGNAATARDLSGGWWDAGDVNKYITFAQPPVHQLLTAYSERKQVFGDDFNIPESGNGIPDLLDELKVELDWMRKMQPSDLNGGVLPKVGNIDHGDPIPANSKLPRFYYPEPCSSATVALAGMFAHAALVLREVPPLKSYADDLTERAKRAWSYFSQHPRQTECDDSTIKSGDSDKSLVEQEQTSAVAAIYLFALTGDKAYAEAVAKSFRATRPMIEDRWSAYDPEQGEALMYYTTLSQADPAIKQAILERKTSQARTVDIYGMKPDLDLYRAYMRDDSFHWAHNMVVANVGNTNYDVVQYKLFEGAAANTFVERAEGLLNSFHGVNAMGLVYLTNMYGYGAERSVNQIYHAWYRDGDPLYDDALKSAFGPAPGYVPGGANHQYCAGQDPSKNRCATSRLRQQPLQKAYLDFNTAWAPDTEHDRSWEITEPGIYYQAAYVKLVSKFVE